MLLPLFSAVAPRMLPFSFGDEPLEEDQPVSVQCMITAGDLPVNVTWEFNRQVIEPSDIISVVRLNRRASALSIDSVKEFHAGNYTCIAVNKAGTASHSSELYVNGSSIKISILFLYL